MTISHYYTDYLDVSVLTVHLLSLCSFVNTLL